MSLELLVNGKTHRVDADPGTPLLSVLRNKLDLTGAKYGCGEGQCGACTVLIDGRAVRSCITPVRTVAGKRVTTIEGSAQKGKLHPVQEAFLACGRASVRLLHARHGDFGGSSVEQGSEPNGREHQARHGRQRLPLRNIPSNHRRCAHGGGSIERSRKMMIEPERYELREGPAYDFPPSRREFFQRLGRWSAGDRAHRNCGRAGIGPGAKAWRVGPPSDAQRDRRLDPHRAKMAPSPLTPARPRWDRTSARRSPRLWLRNSALPWRRSSW